MTEQTVDTPAGRSVAEVKRAPIITTDVIPVLDTGRFEQMQRVAVAMADMSILPPTLVAPTPRGTVANCFKIVNQAVRWGVDPFALIDCAFVVHGKLGYEGKVIAAIINSKVPGRLKYDYDFEGEERCVIVSAQIEGEDKERTVEGTVEQWSTKTEAWQKDPDQMLSYRGARQWARRHMPEVILGVYSVDELVAMHNLVQDPTTGDYVPSEPRPTRAAPETSEVTEVKAGAEWFVFDEVGQEVLETTNPEDAADKLAELIGAAPTEDVANQLLENNASLIQAFADSGLTELHALFVEPESAAQDDAPANDGAKVDPEPEHKGKPELFIVRGPKGGELVIFDNPKGWLNGLNYHLETHAKAAAIWQQNAGTVLDIAHRFPEFKPGCDALITVWGQSETEAAE